VKKRALYAAAGLLAFAPPFHAHDIITTNLTFSRDVSRIFASHCLSCHGSGTDIPLTTYQEARPWL
jgi:mono/diheme cytochrome c family protein